MPVGCLPLFWDARGIRMAPGSPSTARTASAGAVPDGPRGVSRECRIAWPPGVRDDLERHPPGVPNEEEFFVFSLAPPLWLTRQCGAWSHVSEGAAARRPPPPRARRQRGAEGSGGRDARWVPGGGPRRSRAWAPVGAPPRRSTKTALTRAPAAFWKKYDRTAGPWLAWCCPCLAGPLAACLPASGVLDCLWPLAGRFGCCPRDFWPLVAVPDLLAVWAPGLLVALTSVSLRLAPPLRPLPCARLLAALSASAALGPLLSPPRPAGFLPALLAPLGGTPSDTKTPPLSRRELQDS